MNDRELWIGRGGRRARGSDGSEAGMVATCGGRVRTEPVDEATPHGACGGGDGGEPATAGHAGSEGAPTGTGGTSGAGGASAETGDALELARERAAANPPEPATSLVVIATSDPTTCDGPAATAAAAALLRDEDVRTHVIGFGEVALEPLDALAAAGGTSLAMWVEETNLELELVNALRVTTAPVGACELELPGPPPDIELDFGAIRVTYRPADGRDRIVPPVSGPEGCTDGGYYFDDPIVPRILRLCPCTCADATPGRIEVRFACLPQSNGY